MLLIKFRFCTVFRDSPICMSRRYTLLPTRALFKESFHLCFHSLKASMWKEVDTVMEFHQYGH